MTLEVHYNVEGHGSRTVPDYIEFNNGICLDWDESNVSDGILYAKGVCIGEEYGDGRLDELKSLTITGGQFYDYDTDEEIPYAPGMITSLVIDDTTPDKSNIYTFPIESDKETEEHDDI